MVEEVEGELGGLKLSSIKVEGTKNPLSNKVDVIL